MTEQQQIHPPDSPMLIRTMQMTFIAENIAIILNIALLSTAYYQIKTEKHRIAALTPTLPQHTPKSNAQRSSSLRAGSKKPKTLNQETVYVTWAVLIVGFIFSLCQGLIENWLTNDCGATWLQWLTFFFYAAHRALILFSFLHRLMIVFKGSAYSYPDWFYHSSMVAIGLYFVASYIIYGVDHDVTKVNIEMYTGFSGPILCSWSFGVLMPGIARPIEITLTLILVIAFLYKLWGLHRLLVNNDAHSGEHRRINKLLVVFRKVTLLTLSAISTTLLVTLGYTHYKPFAFALSLDAVFNSFCVFLMFQFNQKFIRPCFGNKCDRFCCIKCRGLCKCTIICGCVCQDRTAQSMGIKEDISFTDKTTSIEMSPKPSRTGSSDKSADQSAQYH